jgi:hypothetical protein
MHPFLGTAPRDLWEITENLHRAELTVLERSEQIEEWRVLTNQRVVQVAHPSGGEQPTQAGVSETARNLGIGRREIQRSSRIASIAPEARQAAREAGLGTKGSQKPSGGP